MVVFGQGGGIRVKVVVFGPKWLYSGIVAVFRQKDCTPAKKMFYSGNVVVFGEKWLYSGSVVVIGQKWLYSRKVVVF